jgi:hypothetical protein
VGTAYISRTGWWIGRMAGGFSTFTLILIIGGGFIIFSILNAILPEGIKKILRDMFFP